MKVLIACEFSGIVRDAFIKKGHDAVSCDLLPTERPGPHIQGDVLDIDDLDKELLRETYDLVIGHPPCTYLCNSGVRWLHNKDKSINHDRWLKMQEASYFFGRLLHFESRMVAIENPIPHKYAIREIGSKYNQIIQPWQFGHGETKATCLWLYGLPKLKPTNIVSGRKARIHKMPPSKDRGRLRSITYQGIANAMASQWGCI